MSEKNLIFTFSGIRGIVGRDLNPEIAKKIAIAFGSWLTKDIRKVIIARDTRPSGLLIEKGLIEGLVSLGFDVINIGICPTPVLIYMKNKLKIPAGLIITGSHNPPEWNGIKLLSSNNYLNTEDLKNIRELMNQAELNPHPKKMRVGKVVLLNPIQEYLEDLEKQINIKKRRKNKLRVVLDTGAGAGRVVTPKLLKDLGCEVKLINDEIYLDNVFPRGIEPIADNLHDLIMEVWQGKYDIGFAHDCDADRLAIIGEEGIYYSEDIGLALIMEFYLQNLENGFEDVIFVTNLASSLMFEAIAEKYGARVIRTSIGELFLVDKMRKIIEEDISKKNFIFGGEGSCGGVIIPSFNNTRDGIFAAAKIIEILATSGEKLSTLVSKLPKYYTHREYIKINNLNVNRLISRIYEELRNEGEQVSQINNDLKFGKSKEWFVLIHPSNTEPIIRVISESRSAPMARIYCQTTAELVKLVISDF
jgi:phosphomannomutase